MSEETVIQLAVCVADLSQRPLGRAGTLELAGAVARLQTALAVRLDVLSRCVVPFRA